MRRRIVVVARARVASEIATALAPRFLIDVAARAEDSRLAVETGTEIAAYLIDVGLPNRSGLSLAERITAVAPGLPVVFVADAVERDTLVFAARLFAPVILWPFLAADVSDLLANADRRAIGSVARVLRADFDTEARGAGLTPDEKAVSWMAVLGAATKEAATARGVAVRTVEAQRYEILKKLDIATIDKFRWRLLGRVLPDWRTKK